MNVNLVEALLEQITPSTVNRVAQSTAETPTKARAALTASALAVLVSLVRRGSTRAGAEAMLPALTDYHEVVPRDTSSRGLATSTATATDLAPVLLGEDDEEVTDTVMRSSGVSRSTASSAIAVMLPLASGVVGREVTSKGLDADGLVGLLGEQRPLAQGPHVFVGRGQMETPVGSSRVDLQACKLEYSIVSPK